MAICHPVTSRQFRTKRRAIEMALSSWLIVFLLMLPVFLLATVTNYEENGESKAQCFILIGKSSDDVSDDPILVNSR